MEVDYKPGDDELKKTRGKKKKRKSQTNGDSGEPKKKRRTGPKGPQLKGCITCDLPRTMTKEQWNEHETEKQLGKLFSRPSLVSLDHIGLPIFTSLEAPILIRTNKK